MASYPFVGYQFKLLPDVMTEVRKHGVKAKHMSTGERSMLSAFQESAQAIQHDQTGALVPFWRFFDTISKDLEHGIIQVVVCAERAAENAEGLESYDVRVLKLLYLIRYIGYVKATVENISILMIDSLDVDKRALKDRVKESLARLERENKVARRGDTYSFLTDEEQEIAQEIARTPIDNAKVIEYIKKRLFDSIYNAYKFHRDPNDFPFDRYVDGSIHGSSKGGMELSVVTMAGDLARADDAELALKSVDKAIVALGDEVDYWAPLVNAAKIRMYAQTRNLQELPPSTRQIVEAKMREAAYNEKEADALLSEAVLHARCAVNGRMVEVRATKPAQVFEQVLAQLCDVVFEKAGYIARRLRTIPIFAPRWRVTSRRGSMAWMRATRVRSGRSRTTSKCSISAIWIPLWAISNASTSKGPLAGVRSTSPMWWRSSWWSSARRCCLAARRSRPTTTVWWHSCARMPIRPRCACACV